MDKFKRINLEITTACNLSCSFCPYSSKQNHKAVHLSPDHFSHIAKQAHPLTEQLTLHLLGEPLCHPQFGEILKQAEVIDIPIEITTNGLLLEKHRELLLASRSLKQINFSLQSFVDNFPHDDIGPYMQHILHFSKDLSASLPNTYVNFRWWINPGHEQIFERIVSMIESYFNVSISRKFDVANIKSKKIWQKVYLHFDSRFEWPNLSAPFVGNKGRCHALATHIGIHADGTVVPCCLDVDKVMALGNCLETPLTDILSQSRVCEMIDGFARGDLVETLCQHCSFIKRFEKKGKNGKAR